MSAAPDMRLVLSNRPENVALVRQALGGLANSMGIHESLLADIKTAVSEACNNVVLHAYADESGPLEVFVCPDAHEIEVVVRDEGTGIQPRSPSAKRPCRASACHSSRPSPRRSSSAAPIREPRSA